MTTPEAKTKTETPFQIVVADMKRRETEIAAVLPAHVPSSKFHRILISVLSTNPDMVKVASSSPDARMSLNREVMKAAQDGLVLDGREAALVKFVRKRKNKETGKDEYVDELKYMPMVQGVLKRMRNSGEIASIEVEVVYENDFFDLEKGDNAYLKHRPWYVREKEGIQEPGKIRLAYVSALLKDGTRVREVINRFDIAKLKAASRSKDREGNVVGPWKDWEDEMWRKSVLHRAAKYLPKSSDKEGGENVVSLLERDNELYDVVDNETGEVTQAGRSRTPARPKTEPKTIDGTASETPPAGKGGPKKGASAPPPPPPPPQEEEREEDPPGGSASDLLSGDDENPDDLI